MDMAQTPLPPPNPSGRVGSRSADEQALLQARLARLAARSAAHPSKTGGSPTGGSSPRPAPGRRHPAAQARMAAVGLSVATTAGLVALFAFGKTAGAGSDAAGSGAIVRTSGTSGSTGTVAPTTTATTTPASTATAAPATTAAGSAAQVTNPPTTAATTTNTPVTE